MNESGAAGVRQAMTRRSAAGISLKESETRIKQLESENSELRIECDLWRQQMRPDEARNKIITLSKELTRLRRGNVDLMRVLKEQDGTLKESKRVLKRWGDLDPKEEIQKRQNLEQELEEARAALERERHARTRAEEELEVAQSSANGVGDESQIGRLRQLLEDQREDHAEELYAVQRKNEELEERLEAGRGNSSRTTQGDREGLEDDIAELEADLRRKEAENDDLLGRIDELENIRARHETELEHLRGELQQVQAAEDSHIRELEVAQQRLEHIAADQENDAERSRIAEDALMDKLGSQMNQIRDELTAARLQIQQQKQSIEAKDRQLDDDAVRMEALELELDGAANAIEERNEDIEVLNEANEKLKGDLDDADADIRDLEVQLNKKNAEVDEANQELAEISQKLMDAEEEVEVLRQEVAGFETDNVELSKQLQELQERSERREMAYKERLAQTEELKQEIQNQLLAIERDYQNAAEDSRVLGRDVDGLQQERKDLQVELEKVYEKLEDAIEDLKEEEKKREAAEDELERRLSSEQTKWTRMLDEKEEALGGLEKEIEVMQENVAISKGDVARLQDALRDKENESVRLGQTHSTDRYSLELEIDRLKRDLGRCEVDLDRARKETERKEEGLREKEKMLDDLHAQLRDASSKFAAESQTRLGLEERLDAQIKAVVAAEREAAQHRGKAEELEREANVGERSVMQAEASVKTQLTERNTLLLTIYQYMGKILGSATPRKRGEGDLKPFTNFAVFHDSLIARLRRVSDIQVQFEHKAKAIEDKFNDKFTALKRQHESKFRQIDRCEAALKSATEKQTQWRARLVTKQSETEAIKATNTELQQQIASLRARSSLSSPADASKINALTSRANNAERRLNTLQNQSVLAEERLTEAKNKYAEGEGKWAARIKELESRCKAAEERVKRERQGARERVVELEEELQRMRRSLEGEKKRVKVLDNIQTG